MFGAERGQKLVAFVGGAADAVFDLIARHRMDVAHSRDGWIQAVHSPATLDAVRRRCDQWARRGASVQWLDRQETERHLGTSQYVAGWLDRRGGAVQPLAYARGLARAALAAGAAVHGATPATGIARRNGKWTVATRGGATVTADRVAGLFIRCKPTTNMAATST